MTPEERHLERMLERYARACPEVEPGSNFMPGVWQRIDARRSFSFKLASYAKILTMTAASLCLAAGLFEVSAYGPATQLVCNRFVEILDDDSDSEALIYGLHVAPDQPRNEIGGEGK